MFTASITESIRIQTPQLHEFKKMIEHSCAECRKIVWKRVPQGGWRITSEVRTVSTCNTETSGLKHLPNIVLQRGDWKQCSEFE